MKVNLKIVNSYLAISIAAFFMHACMHMTAGAPLKDFLHTKSIIISNITKYTQCHDMVHACTVMYMHGAI